VIEELASVLDTIELGPGSLHLLLDLVPDHRDPRGIRHPLGTLLVCAIGAVAAGADSFAAISRWAHRSGPARLLGLDTAPHGSPSESCLRTNLRDLDADALDLALAAWITALLPAPETLWSLAVDGKTQRGSGRTHHSRSHLLAGLHVPTGTVLGQVDVNGKTNEITRFEALLDTVDLAGAVVSADALHCQVAHATYLVEQRGAHFLLCAKANQPSLFAELSVLGWDSVPLVGRDDEAERGRATIREYRILSTGGAITLDFPHIAQILRVDRTRTRRGKTVIETAFYITSLTWTDAAAKTLIAWVRQHWHVENRLHLVRDVTFGEDRSQIRTGNAPRAMASIRNLIISAFRLAGVDNIRAAREDCAADPERINTLILNRHNGL
jgi:predicted transposase YbfD/YdcC